MKRNLLFVVLAITGLLLWMSSCQKAPELTLTSSSNIEFSADGSSGSITFTANRDWTARANDSWVSVSPSSGAASDGSVTVSVRCNANTTYEDRSTTVTINMGDLSQTVSVKQPANKGIVLPKQVFDLQSDTRSIDVEVQANVQYSVSTSANWIKQVGTKALSSKTLSFSIEENKTYDPREGKITIKPTEGNVQEQVITVRQAQKAAMNVEKTSYEMPYGGGEIEIKVESNVSFDVTPNVDWLHYTQTKALSTSTVCIKVDENPTYSNREGKIEITQKNGSLKHTITVKQAGRIAVTSVELNKTSLQLKEGGTETLIATVKPDNATDKTVSWSSSDTGIATIDANGKVTAIKEGNATITAKAGDKTASCSVTIKNTPIMEAVDLGLSVKWASFNIGAEKPEEYGEYYAWGEIDPIVEYYGKRSYKWLGESGLGVTKYCPKERVKNWAGAGEPDGKTMLDPEDDIAQLTLGGKWRMPTREEYNELLTNCSWTWTTSNGVSGYNVASKVNTNSIFLPVAGYWIEKPEFVGTSGLYWTSTLNDNQYDSHSNIPYKAYNLYLTAWEHVISSGSRSYGYSIRPVFEEASANPFVAVSSIALNKTDLKLKKEESETLVAIIKPDNATDKTVTWSSSDSAVAIVDNNGKVTAIKEGYATITAQTGTVSAVCTVSITQKQYQAEAIDLGLIITRPDGSRYKLLWADRNLGASSTEEYGDYFAWGQSAANKSTYSQATYDLTKYNADDGKTELGLEDDTARVLLGGEWRMPTLEEWSALMNSTSGNWVTKNGINGLEITSKSNGRSIFLPAAGNIANAEYSYVGDSGMYWSSTLSDSNIQYAKYSSFNQSKWEMPMRRRWFGLTIRAVLAKEISEPQSVDLGLSVKWASWNIGASAPEEFGDYYGWGETEPKTDYSWETYKTNSSYGFEDVDGGNAVIEENDDVAHITLGGKWRIPTDAEWTELRENCTCSWTMQNGVNGTFFTSIKNGASIFLPAAGSRVGSNHNRANQSGYYWSSSLQWTEQSSAWLVSHFSGGVERAYAYRYYGQSIRPVTE